MNNDGNVCLEAQPAPANLQAILLSPAMRQAMAIAGNFLRHHVELNDLDAWQHPMVGQVLTNMMILSAKKAATAPVTKPILTPNDDMTPQDQQPAAFVVTKAKRARRQLSTSEDAQPRAKQAKAAPLPRSQSSVHNSCFPDVAVHCDSLGLVNGVAAAMESIATRTGHALVALIEPRIQAGSPVFGNSVNGVALFRYATVVLSQGVEKLADDTLLYCASRRLQSNQPRVAEQLAQAVCKKVPLLLRKVLRNVQTALQACPDVDQSRARAVLQAMAESARPLYAKAVLSANPIRAGSEPQHSDGESVEDGMAWLQPTRVVLASSSSSTASSVLEVPLEN
eukprot:m.29924 g.29924  ORF g.29924 m.29924 type:complete len:338 (+) comp11986_c0_seq1:322-1335(+)